jgi:tyrosine-protein kinase Etk/Wzc
MTETVQPRPDQPQTKTPGPGEKEIDLLRLLLVVWRSRYIVAAMTVLGIFVGTFLAASRTPIYQADALIQLEQRSGMMAMPESMQDLMGSNPRTATEIELLRSRAVIGRVVAELDLDVRVEPAKAPVIGEILSRYALPIPETALLQEYTRLGDRLVLDSLQVPPDWIGQPIALTVTETGFTVVLPDGSTRDGRVRQAILDEATGFALTIGEITAAPGRRYTLRQIPQSAAISSVQKALSIFERGQISSILDVRVVGPDPSANVRILDALLAAYVGQNINRSAAEAESSLAFIRSQIPQAQADLRAAEEALNSYRQSQASVDLGLETETLLSQITAVETELDRLRREEDEFRERFTPTHPTYRRLLDERALLEERLADLRNSAGSLPETQQVILNLSRDVAVREQIYTQLVSRAQEIEVLRAGTVGNVRVVDSASSFGQIAPRRSRIVAVTALLAALAGMALALVRDAMRRGIQDPAEIERLGLSVFATIGYASEADGQGARRGRLNLLAVSDPSHLSIEAFRSLRTSLHFGLLDAKTRSIVITSAAPGAGKSFTSANLAAVAAQAGQKVCLIDADLRRGQLRRYFGLERSHKGLADVLAKNATLDEALVPAGIDGLYFLSTGPYPPNPSELLMRKEFADLLETLDTQFDLIIVDAPPTLAVTDPVIIGRSAGASLVVVRHDDTPQGELLAVMKAFETSQVRINGAILNAYDPRKGKVTYGYAYGYGYGYSRQYAYRSSDK